MSEFNSPQSIISFLSSFESKLRNLRYELTGAAFLLTLGVLPRLLFVTFYPSRPVSDFYNILKLALSFEKDFLARGNIYWNYFSAGLPLALSFLFRILPFQPQDIARWATAVASGLPAVVPFLLWRRIFSTQVRLLAGILLAVWPGQIIFSGVLAQDNWIILPTIILAALGVRILVGQRQGNPIWAGLLFAGTVAIRQEMFLALIPVTAVAMLGGQKKKWIHNLLVGSIIVDLIFGTLIIQRGLSTRRYALTTNHLGVSILGAYIPGAGMGWVSPMPYLNTVKPEILDDENFEEEAVQLTKQEFLRRPGFHAVRIIGSTLYNLFGIDEQIIYWSLTAEGVLPHAYRKGANILTDSIKPLLAFYPIFIHGLFLVSVFFIFSKRDPLLKWTASILATIILKIGLHAVIVSQPRYFLVVEALEMLIIAIALDAMTRKENWKKTLRSAVLGLISVAALLVITAQAQKYVQTNDIQSSRNEAIIQAINFEPRLHGMEHNCNWKLLERL
jgi:hypothetical protein